MEPNLRDTPIRRFNTFWWGTSLFVVFGIACFFFRVLFSGEATDVDSERGAARLVIKENVDSAQASALKVDPASVFSEMKGLLDAEPTKSGVVAPKQ